NRVLVRPRFGQGGTDKVVGYSVALEPKTINGVRQDPVWYAPSKLDKGIGLGALRQSWPKESQHQALASWQLHSTRAGDLTTAGKITTRPVPDTMVRRLTEAERSAAMNPTVAADVAATFAHLSLTFERGTPGPFARAANNIAAGHQRGLPT